MEQEKQIRLQDKFKNLSKTDQEFAINFFNLHNSAIFLYTQCSDDAKAYIDYSIELSQELNAIPLDRQMKDQKDSMDSLAESLGLKHEKADVFETLEDASRATIEELRLANSVEDEDIHVDLPF